MFARISTLALAGIALGALTGCNADEGPFGPAVVVDTQVLSSAQITAGVEVASGIVGTRNGSDSPAAFAALGTIPRSVLGSLDLYQVAPGGRTTLSLDLNGVDVPEDLKVFLISNGPTLLAWETGNHCFLAYEAAGVQWYIDTTCGTDGGLICSYGSAAECVFCDAENCSECEFDGTDSERVTCVEIVEPEPEPVPDVSVDAGEDVSEDTGTVDEDTGSVDIGVGDDAGSEDAGSPDVSVDAGSASGACESACMSEPDAVCCTSCGCGAQDCLPQCASPFVWDCEVECCFNYETFECE